MSDLDEVWIGVDVGGTSVRAGVMRRSGELLGPLLDLRREADIESQLDQIAGVLTELATAASTRIVATGLALPGSIDPLTGRLSSAPTAPALLDWNPHCGVLAQAGAVRLLNDANAALLGEWHFGTARGSADVVALFVGTGTGADVIINGEMLVGSRGIGGELGHIVVAPGYGPDCPCGGSGCLEQLASGTAIARRYAELSGQLADGSASVAEAALRGDLAAQQAFAEAGRWLGLAAASLANIFNPQVIVIGGGAAAAWDLLAPTSRAAVERHTMPLAAQGLQVRPGSLSRNAGVIGAAVASQELGKW
ncbi:MAG: ROK family protein [Jatrophihabitans sp.]